MTCRHKWLGTVVATAMLLSLGAAALASNWGGHNGLVRLSFTDGDTLTSTATVAADRTGMTKVDLYAILDGVENVVYNDSTFDAVGGFECELKIEGGDPLIAHQDFPYQNFNVGQKPGQVRLGIVPGLALKNGRATMVHWQLLFSSAPKNVVFRLDPKGAMSCDGLEGCSGSGTDALFSGSMAKGQEGLLFSAVCAPAYLNWDKPPQQEVKPGKPSWHDVPLFAEAGGNTDRLPAQAAEKVLQDKQKAQPAKKDKSEGDGK